MNVKIEESWKKALQPEFEKPYFVELANFVKNEYKSKTVYPPPEFIFHAFDLCPLDRIKVVILGQDPYHGHGQANGLCFAVSQGIALPPSLQNIFKEIESDLGQSVNKSGDLERWARQGILLLNATLTVIASQAASHQGKGWEEFTDAVISMLSAQKEHLVFLLWGRYAQEKEGLIDGSRHFILKAAHPSPFSAFNGFFGCKHFSKTNEYLEFLGEKPIEW
ncbi:MAG: uracil-DNA glycosylase [Patescibacteria group bacterium]